MDMLFRRPRHRPCLIGLAGLSALALAAAPVAAQQVTAAKGAVTIDLGVLNQLGAPATSGGYYPYSQAPGYAPAYGQSAYGQPAYAQPAYNGYNPYPTQATGALLYPPTQSPASTLTVPPPPGSTPYVPEQPAAALTANVAGSPPPPPSTPATPAEATNQTTTPAPAASTDTTASTAGTIATGAAATTTAAASDTGSVATSTGTSAAPAAPAVPAVPAATGQSGTAATGGQTTTAAATDTTGGTSTATAAPTTGQTMTASTGTASTGTASTGTAPVEGQLQIAFPKDSADIPDAAKSELDSLAQKMTANDSMRLQLLAYASGTPDTASRARRMSLSRALAVRSYLIKKGVVSTRMDVRALGSNVQGEPADRVDILPKAS